jgi:hypothetical protein
MNIKIQAPPKARWEIERPMGNTIFGGAQREMKYGPILRVREMFLKYCVQTDRPTFPYRFGAYKNRGQLSKSKWEAEY